MKLGKALIVSGVLFSSILGSVNVNSITAMAAENDHSVTKVPVINGNIKELHIEYIDRNGKEVVNEHFKKTITIEDNKKPIDANMIDIPEGFKIMGVSLKSSGMTVTLKEISRANINILFVAENGVVLPARTILEDRDVQQPILSSDITSFPKGYTVIPNQKYVVMLKKEANGVTSYSAKVVVKKATDTPIKHHSNSIHHAVVTSKQRVRITFVDQASKDFVGNKQIEGLPSSTTKIQAPKHYTFVNVNDATIKFDKKGNKDIQILVKKDVVTPVMQEGVVTTNGGSYKNLYTLEGKLISNRGLAAHSQWYTDQYVTVNGEKMYRVATNEWVKASDVK